MKSLFKSVNKKIISLAMVAVMLICAVPFSGSIDYSSWFTIEADAFTSEYTEEMRYVAECFKSIDANNATIDMSKFEITTTEFSDFMDDFARAYPVEYAIYCLYDISYTYNKTTYEISTLTMTTQFWSDDPCDLDDFSTYLENLELVVAEIVSVTEDMSDFEKIVYLHDYLILSSYYDTTYTIYTAYIILVEGTGVCQAYALAYQLLLREVGIDCLYVTSTSMNHGWNLVELDGEWYHVDVTWDDPTSSTITSAEGYETGTESGYVGRLRRTYFLLNDDEMEANNHSNWTVEYESTSTTYSDMPRYSNAIQTYANDMWYFCNNGYLYSCDDDGSNISTSIASRNGSAIAVYGDYYIYGDGETIKAQSMTDLSDVQTIYTLEDTTDNSYQYYTFFVQDGSLYYYYDLSSNFKYIDSDYENDYVGIHTISAIECESPVSLSMLNTSEDTSETTTAATTETTTAATTETTTETTTAATTEIDSSGCDCICHSTSGFEQFFYKIALFFWDLFNMNQVCECGVYHY